MSDRTLDSNGDGTAFGAPPLLVGRALARRYGTVEALAETTIAFESGQIVAIVGANGSGKSTLLRALAGVVQGEGASGTVEIEGRARARMEAAAVRAFVPQRPEIAADFTAREVVRLGRFARGADESAVDRALRSVGLAQRAGIAVRALSGGERQRVAVARALAQIDGAARGVLLLDEPFSGVDPAEVARLIGVLRDRARSGVVLATLHDPGLARAFATHAVVLAGGRVLAAGEARATLSVETLSQAYRHPMDEVSGWIAPRFDPSR